MTIEHNILQVLTRCRDEIRANMSSKGINASGRTSRGFKVVQDEQSISLILDRSERVSIECKPRGLGSVIASVAPLHTVEIGREGGKVPRGFYYIIKQWTRDKGLRFGSESERQRFAYFTARKIAKDGTGRNKNHVDVYSTPVKQARERLNADIRAIILTTIRQAQINF